MSAGPVKLNRIPTATYRLQFQSKFALAQAGAILGYLQELGISDIYASPLFTARPESTHGYDVCSFGEIDPKLGGGAAFEAFAGTVRAGKMGLLLDMVPNHMGIGPANAMWMDVLKFGRRSKYAGFFDIHWDSRADGKILLPVLGDRYGEVLKRGELQLLWENEKLSIGYFDKRFPAAPETELEIVGERAEGGPLQQLLARRLAEINKDPERLDQILAEQHYRLAFWRVGSQEINYRRFFDVTELVSVRVEDEQVFAETHRLLFELLRRGAITGVRIDHPDGLRDPQTYFARLQASYRTTPSSPGLFVVAEKILSNNELLPEDWPIAGTTGYDFLNVLNGIFVERANEREFSELYANFTGLTESYEEVEYRAKMEALEKLFPKEVSALTERLRQIADATVEGVDFTTPELRQSLSEFIAAFPVYRTYARPGKEHLTAEEEFYVQHAVEKARHRKPALRAALGYLRSLLQLRPAGVKDAATLEVCQEFVYRLQQLTGPATAKGVEDTAFYRYLRLVSLNEVGGNPGQFGKDVEGFHAHNLHSSRRWPHTQLATATHDTKRGEDVRARLNILSEMTGAWRERIGTWEEMNRPFKTGTDINASPSANDEYLLYQALVGTWTGRDALEEYAGRLRDYMQKATREAKLRTSWTDPCEDYEKATAQFVESILRHEPFLQSLESFMGPVSFFGTFNSLAQVVLKIFSPGFPDFYQGSELWDLSLVDPDNRRAVDYVVREQMLRRIKSGHHRGEYRAGLLQSPESGELKMFTLWSALQVRNRAADLLARGEYLPLRAEGQKGDHVVCFARTLQDRCIIAVAPRLPFGLMGGKRQVPIGSEVWQDTRLRLPSGSFRDQFTSRTVAGVAQVGDILSEFPVAVLESQ